ncbi:MAG: sugar ABC transporter ATP-binding protein [Clostridiales bacterium]|nr:sugar ABC transporter ATP-binding protein [Clostridiales bacterium]
MSGITKQFPGVKALDGVDFDLKKGEIHALVGENGAGKSTLMNMLGGNLKPDSGMIELEGKRVSISGPMESLELGIGFVHQESNLLSNLTVLENVFLAREKRRHGTLDRAAMRKEILRVNERLGYQLNPDAQVGSLHLAEQQCVEITRALLSEPRILILDEPTAALDDSEVARLFDIVRRLRGEGVAIIYISHRLDEIFQLADRITVLKDGKVVGTRATGEVTKDEVIAMMVGRVLEDIYPKRDDITFGDTLLSVENLSIPGRLSNVSFSVRAGEIVGLGGLEGQGQRDAARAIFGDVPFAQGRITANGLELKSRGIRGRIRRGVGYVTHDRRGEGLVLNESVRKNAALASLYRRSRLGFVDAAAERREADENVERMQIKTAGLEQKVANLSGGNQQKVMLARWLMTKPRVLIIDEPTKGVDVGARMSVYQIIDQLTREGIGIIMLTSDMMELIGLSDRVLVFYEGRISRELKRGEATEERIMRAASSMPDE